MSSFKAPRGAKDVLPPNSEFREALLRKSEDLFKVFGYRRIETPIFEHTEVFERGLQSESDLVVKEMYKFKDRSGRSLTLRPEGTAPVVRATLEHNLHRRGLPLKLYYTGPSFRYERPQEGRNRIFWQAGVEAFGSDGPQIDAEVIELAWESCKAAAVVADLKINSIGHRECRASYLPKLVEYLRQNEATLCEDCRRKIETNPLRTFDCKVAHDAEIMAKAPKITDNLCEACQTHFDGVKALLEEASIPFLVEPTLVRGLDYYTRTTFVLEGEGLGAQNEVCGGGRYDGLSEQFGGDRLTGIGFGLGIDRLCLAAAATEDPALLDLFVGWIGSQGEVKAREVTRRLRASGIRTEQNLEDRQVRRQLGAADRLGARFVVVVGDEEARTGTFKVRDMASGEETSVEESGLAGFVRNAE